MTIPCKQSSVTSLTPSSDYIKQFYMLAVSEKLSSRTVEGIKFLSYAYSVLLGDIWMCFGLWIFIAAGYFFIPMLID